MPACAGMTRAAKAFVPAVTENSILAMLLVVHALA
jgi:hypothetical protein